MPVIEYFYSAHSAFAYLGAGRLADIARTHGATVVHRPFDLSPVVEAQGSLPFRDRTQAHVDYFFGREIERWAEFRDVSIRPARPTFHDTDYALAGRMILALGDRGEAVDKLAHAVMRAHWVDDADLSDAKSLGALAVGLGLDGEALLRAAQASETREKYDANTREAAARRVMGSPTYIVGDDAFYGQDRLEMMERALVQPFRPPVWRNPPVDG